ncbi:MAG: thermonuclease family protein [Treponema sp.]|nr:thermonuclease family protein [Treponema sp.]
MKRIIQKAVVSAVLLILFAAPAFSQSGLTAAVVARVIDGDTVVLADGERVRFLGVDTPEVGMPGASEATRFVREHVEGRTVWLESDSADRDKYGRLLRYIWLEMPSDPQDENQIRQYQLNALLLTNGLARVMIIGKVKNAALFRQLSTSVSATSSAAPSPAGNAASAPESAAFIGNRNSLIFHIPRCTVLPATQNRVYFDTREDATAANFRPCNRCNP